MIDTKKPSRKREGFFVFAAAARRWGLGFNPSGRCETPYGEHAAPHELRSGKEDDENDQFLEGVGGNGVAYPLTDERPGHHRSRGKG